MNRHKSFNLLTLIILVLAISFSLPEKQVDAQSYEPIAVVFIEDNHIVGFHWPVGTVLTLSIDDPTTPEPVDYSDNETVLADPDPNVTGSTAARFWLGDAFRVKPGYTVTLNGGGIAKIHTVTSLTRDGVDMPGDRLWGYADPGTVVEVRNRWQRDIVRWETAGLTGYWEANFSIPGDDLPEEALTHDFGLNTYFMIMQSDEDGDHTQYNWEMPFPTMEVRLTQNALSWQNWPSGYPIDISFDDPTTPSNPDYSITAGPEPPVHPDAPYCPCMPMGDGYRLRPGHVVTMTNGFLTKTHTVSTLQVEGINSALDTVSGMAEPGAEVYVQRYNVPRHVIADGTGSWIADFSIPGDQDDEQLTYDLMPWDDGIAMVTDEDDDTTEVTWTIDMGIYVGDGIWANNWYAGDEVTLTINDPSTPAPVDFTSSAFSMVGPWFYTGIRFDIGQAFRTRPGHVVSLAQTDHNKTCVVSPIRITGVDFNTDQVQGISSPNDQVQVGVSLGQGDEWARNRYGEADVTGHWEVDFSQTGTHIIRHPDEIKVVDIVSNMSVEASVGDDNSCFTTVEWVMPAIRVRLAAGEIYTRNFVPGYPVMLTIYKPDDLVNPIYTDTKIMGNDDLIIFDYPDTLNISAGFIIRATDGVMTKEHVVTSVWIDDVDIEKDRVYGVAKAGTSVTIVARSSTLRAQRDLITGIDGTWTADFSVPGVEPWEQDIIDLDMAYITFAYQTDDDNDMTWVHWMFNQPPDVGLITGPEAPVLVNTLLQVSANFTDPDIGDTHLALWDWGDGMTSEGFIDEAAKTVYGNHTYTEVGIYTLQLTICDAAGECTDTNYEFIVVYDPTGGFVTGGGWIWSSANAYIPEPELEGKATFGFVSKYQKGANLPTGNTEFQFKAGDLNFKSTSYQWLIINKNDSNAQFKGYGTINGSGNYGFMLWATDDSPDTFRIKIWDANNETIVVYDNGVSQPIGGGSIVVHSK